MKPETATRNKMDLRCRETIPNDFKTANRPKRPDTLQDLKSFLLADFFNYTDYHRRHKGGKSYRETKAPMLRNLDDGEPFRWTGTPEVSSNAGHTLHPKAPATVATGTVQELHDQAQEEQ